MNPSLNPECTPVDAACDRCKLMGLALSLAVVEHNTDPEEIGYFVARFLHHAQIFMQGEEYTDLNRQMDHQVALIYAGQNNELD